MKMYMDINGTSYKSTLTGWRVLSIEGTGDDKYVRLISAGVPMSYDHIYGSTKAQAQTAVKRITTNFFETEIKSTSTDTYFNLCGFKNGSTKITTIAALKKLFTNDYTQTNSSGYPEVSSITKKDLDMLYYGDSDNDGEPDSESVNGTEFDYNDLIHLKASGQTDIYVPYYVAGYTSNSSKYYLWIMYTEGAIVYTGNNYGIRPVVSLKATVETSGQSSNVWQLK